MLLLSSQEFNQHFLSDAVIHPVTDSAARKGDCTVGIVVGLEMFGIEIAIERQGLLSMALRFASSSQLKKHSMMFSWLFQTLVGAHAEAVFIS